jgi:Pyruvate/2-oxoacid:ferredoxin oxidoreductase delta subunit
MSFCRIDDRPIRMSCGNCAGECPCGAIAMVPEET